MRAEVTDKPNNARGVPDGHVLRSPEYSFVKDHRLRGPGQSLILPDPRDPHQYIAMIPGDEGGVDPQVFRDRRLRPTPGERPPRSLEPLERKVPEVCLQQLSDIIAELHVKVPVEDRGGSALLPLPVQQRGRVPENVQGRLPEYPCLRVVPGHHSHADRQVTVTAEDVHGAPETRPLRPGDPCSG